MGIRLMLSRRLMKRILAHRIIYRGMVHEMSVATIVDDRVAGIEPFERECEATVFVPGAIIIEENDGKIKVANIDLPC